MVDYPERIKWRFKHYRETAEAVRDELSQAQEEVSPRSLDFARKQAERAAETGDVSEELKWRMILEGLKDQ